MDDERPARPTDGSIELVEYRVEWPRLFEAERTLLHQRVGHVLVRIEHIGSTSVPGMPSKPTIDMLGGARRVEQILPEVDALYASGYDYREQGFVESEGSHAFFRKVVDGKRTHHLHVVALDSGEFEDYVAFRDFLRAEPDAAGEYAAAKRELFARFPDDRMGYVRGKGRVVDALIVRMRRVP